MKITIWPGLLSCAMLGGCADEFQGEGDELNIDVCDPSGTFSPTITNPFFPQPIGQRATLVDPDGFRVEISALPDTEVVAGVTTRVIHEYETENGTLVEESWNYFAQTPDGTVCYFGERVDIFAGGVVVAHDGEWRADQPGFRAGIQMPADPMVGTFHAQESAPGVAEDYANIVARGETVAVPYGTFTDTLRTEEWTPLEPGNLSRKRYAAGIGLLDDDGAVLTEIATVP